jgi:hypothetical protein
MAVELWGDDVVLATVSFWRGKARVELFTRSRRRRRTVVVGDEAPVEIGMQQRVAEHEQATGKFVQGLIGAERFWCGLPTGVPCAAGAEEDGGGGMWLGCSGLGTGSSRTGCRR